MHKKNTLKKQQIFNFYSHTSLSRQAAYYNWQKKINQQYLNCILYFKYLEIIGELRKYLEPDFSLSAISIINFFKNRVVAHFLGLAWTSYF